jgi:hypothetical protein
VSSSLLQKEGKVAKYLEKRKREKENQRKREKEQQRNRERIKKRNQRRR